VRKLALASIYLYFFVCPLEFVFNALIGSSAKYIAAFSVACVALYYVADRKVKFKIGIIQYALLGWVLLEAASFLWTPPSSMLTDRIETYSLSAAYVLLVSVFPFEEKELKTVVLFYAIGSAVSLILLFVIGDLHYGWNPEGRRTIRINNKWQDPNSLAAYLIAGLFYFVEKIFSKKWYAIPCIAIALAFIYGILQTGSRGALLSLVLTAVLVAFVKAEKKVRFKVLAGALASLVVVYILISSFLPEELINRLFNAETYADGSGRIRIWTAAMQEILRNPFFGNGISSHYAYFNEVLGVDTAMHNAYLCVLFEVGVVGLLAFVIPFLITLYHSYKKKNIFVFSMLICNMVIIFFLDAIHMRYIWNALIIGIVAYNIYKTKDILK